MRHLISQPFCGQTRHKHPPFQDVRLTSALQFSTHSPLFKRRSSYFPSFLCILLNTHGDVRRCIHRCLHPLCTTVIFRIPTQSRPFWRAYRTRTGATTRRSVLFLHASICTRVANASYLRRIQSALSASKRWTSPTPTSSPVLAGTRWASSNHALHACLFGHT